MISIAISRDEEDGGPQTTTLEGSAGLAVTIKGTDITKMLVDATDAKAVMEAQPEMPSISIRASNVGELSMMLAALISAVQAVEPEAVKIAFTLAQYMDSKHPEVYQEHPKEDYTR